MIGFCNHVVTAVMLVIDRARLLPFVVWRDSREHLPAAIDYARQESNRGRKFVLLCHGVGMLRALRPHLEALKALKAHVAVFDTYHALHFLRGGLEIVDAEDRGDGTWQAVELSRAQINNLLLSRRAALHEEAIKLADVAPATVTTAAPTEKPRPVERFGLAPDRVEKRVAHRHVRRDAAPQGLEEDVLPQGPLARTAFQVTTDPELLTLIAHWVLGRVPYEALREALGAADARLLRKAVRVARGPLVRAYHFFRRCPPRHPDRLCRAWRIAKDDVYFLLYYADLDKEAE